MPIDTENIDLKTQQIFHVPFKEFKFSEAFEKLEDLKEKGLIKDFSIYNATLEQAFIHFTKLQFNSRNYNRKQLA